MEERLFCVAWQAGPSNSAGQLLDCHTSCSSPPCVLRHSRLLHRSCSIAALDGRLARQERVRHGRRQTVEAPADGVCAAGREIPALPGAARPVAFQSLRCRTSDELAPHLRALGLGQVCGKGERGGGDDHLIDDPPDKSSFMGTPPLLGQWVGVPALAKGSLLFTACMASTPALPLHPQAFPLFTPAISPYSHTPHAQQPQRQGVLGQAGRLCRCVSRAAPAVPCIRAGPAADGVLHAPHVARPGRQQGRRGALCSMVCSGGEGAGGAGGGARVCIGGGAGREKRLVEGQAPGLHCAWPHAGHARAQTARFLVFENAGWQHLRWRPAPNEDGFGGTARSSTSACRP